MWISLEANLGLGSLRFKAARPLARFWNRHKVILHPSLVIEQVLMLLGVLGWVLLGFFFCVFHCYWQVLPPTKPFKSIQGFAHGWFRLILGGY